MRSLSRGLIVTVLAGSGVAAQPMGGWPFERSETPLVRPAPGAAVPRLQPGQPERGRVRVFTAPTEAGLSYGLTRRARLDAGYRWAPPAHSAPAGPVGETQRGTFIGIRRSLGP